MLQKLTFSCAK